MDAARRLKIAFLIDHYAGPNAGTERQLRLMAEALPNVGVEPRMVVFRHSKFTMSDAFPSHVESIMVGRVASPRSWWRVYRWAQRARSEGVAVAHVFFNDPALFAPACLSAAGMPCIVARRDMGFWYTPARLLMLRRMQRFVSRMTANSRAVADWCGRAERYEPHKRVVIPNAMPTKPPAERRLGEGGFVMGLVANIRPIKRIEDAIRATAALKSSGRDVTLRVIGGGDAGSLRSLSEHLGIADQVEFAGASERVSDELSSFDAALLCSESEGLSNAIMEYMQAGLPVVATDAGGNPELVTDGETGFLYAVGNVDQLAESLARLYDDRALSRRLGAAGAMRIREGFGVDRIANAYASLYREVSEAADISQSAGGKAKHRAGR